MPVIWHGSSTLPDRTRKSFKMKHIKCNAMGCETRRRHHEMPEEPRGPQMVEVPDNHMGPVYCSLECAAYAGALKVDRVEKLYTELDKI